LCETARMRIALIPFVVVGLCACPKKSEEAPKPAPPASVAKPAPKTAEVEFFGEWKAGGVKAAKVIFVAQAEPCTPVPEKATRFGEQKLDTEGNLFAEYFIDQGTKGYACVYALDEGGKIIAAAGTAENPMTFEGSGEVIKANLKFELQSL
jgi:hypothetical protein